MNIKAKSHLKHIYIKIYSKKKKKILIPETRPKHLETAETPRNIYKYVSIVFFVPSEVLKRHIPSVLAGTARN
jgi:hypothetical protein